MSDHAPDPTGLCFYCDRGSIGYRYTTEGWREVCRWHLQRVPYLTVAAIFTWIGFTALGAYIFGRYIGAW